MTTLRMLLWELPYAYRSWRSNFWFLPAIMGLAALGLFAFAVWLDRQISTEATAIRHLPFWFSGTPEASRSLLSTIGSAIGAFATVVFSISIITLQMASQEYTPRLLKTFTRSTISQVTLGTFVSTALFAILTLSIIREEATGQKPFVPDITINIAKLMAMASLSLLVVFIGHITVLISPSRIIRSIREDTLSAYVKFVKGKVGESAPPEAPTSGGTTLHVRALRSGYIQRTRMHLLLNVIERLIRHSEVRHVGVTIRLTIGDYAKDGDTLAEMASEQPVDGYIERAIRRAFVIRESRLPEEDFRYGIDELFSIALRRIRQLDSSTAIECIVALVEVWLRMMRQPLYPPNRRITAHTSSVLLTLVPVDTDTQLAESLRRILDHAIERETLLDVATAVLEGLSTIARESVTDDYPETFRKCWRQLLWSVRQIIHSTEDEIILRRVVHALLPLRECLRNHDTERWEELSELARSMSSVHGKTEPMEPLWEE